MANRVIGATQALLAGLFLGGSLGCTGSIGDRASGEPRSVGEGTGPDGTSSSAPAGGVSGGTAIGDPAPVVVRRLTRTEYNNTVRDLLGDTTGPASAFLVDEQMLGFDNIASAQTVSPVLAEQYMTAAEQIATRAVKTVLGALPCATGSPDDACASTFIKDFGKRAWRRPLSDTEVTRVLGVFHVGSATGGFAPGIELAIRSILTSAPFFFRVETGEAVPNLPGRFRPTSWEMASRLSYLFWGTMPDDALFSAASQNALATPEQVGAQAERLLADPRAHETVAHFHSQWLKLSDIDNTLIKKDTKAFPQFADELVPMMRSETAAFLDDVVWRSPTGLSSLLTGSYSFMNAKLAAFYGVRGPTGDALVKVNLDPAQRAGLLTQAGLLSLLAHTDQTSPTKRGKFVRQRLLCTEIPPPPPTVNAVPSSPAPNLTTRERVAEHKTNQTCATCHNTMDPIGLGFEHYDAAGLWRDQESGKPVDASGSVSGADFDGNFDGVPDLAKKLAASDEVRACVSTQWFRFAYGKVEGDGDAPVVQQLSEALKASGGNFQKLLVGLTQTDAFLYRPAQEGL